MLARPFLLALDHARLAIAASLAVGRGAPRKTASVLK